MKRRALEGIRILEFTRAIAGPNVGKWLGHHGAEAIKVESRVRRDIIGQYIHPRFPQLGPRLDLGYSRDEFNAGKREIGLNTATPRGKEIVDRLVKISDVVVSNYAVRGMKSQGLDYERLREINPGIILLLLPGFGMTGPYWDYLSWGPNQEPIAGFRHLMSWPGGTPVGTGISYPDYIGGYHACMAVLNALIYRQRTGQGQLIDMSQYEASVSLLGPSMMDYMVNGHNQGPWGNRLPHAAPHGAYPCRGEDRWIAITVFTDEEWQGFCRALGNPPWTADPRFATLSGRKEHEDELDELVMAWTSQQDAYEVMFALQKEGVPAGVVQNCEDLIYRDRHVRARNFFPILEHAKQGKVLRTGFALRLLGTPGQTTRAGPIVGQDNDYVFKELLGMFDAEVEELVQLGVIEPPQWEEPDLEYFKEENMLATILR